MYWTPEFMDEIIHKVSEKYESQPFLFVAWLLSIRRDSCGYSQKLNNKKAFHINKINLST